MSITKKDIVVVIPTHTFKLSSDELFSLYSCIDNLREYDTYIVYPSTLNSVDFPVQSENLRFNPLHPSNFESGRSYNSMCLNRWFYEQFSDYEFMFIFQLDGFVFRDDLLKWSEMGYDYVGAPWCHECYDKCKSVDTTSLVGNGGVSLRRIRKFIEILTDGTMCNGAEDKYLHRFTLNMPKCNEAVKFSVENDAARHIANGISPMCCHNLVKLDKNSLCHLVYEAFKTTAIKRNQKQ